MDRDRLDGTRSTGNDHRTWGSGAFTSKNAPAWPVRGRPRSREDTGVACAVNGVTGDRGMHRHPTHLCRFVVQAPTSILI